MRKVFLHLFVGLIALSLAACSTATEPPTAAPTPTPVPTPTPYPTYTSYPTSTPYPTATAMPTLTPYPTLVALPTHTPYPTATAYPTYTPYPTATHRPTYTPRPTATRIPTPTPTPRPLFPASRTFTVQELDTRASKVWKDKNPFMLVGCLAQDEADIAHGESWYTLSFDGRFSEDRYFAHVGGFAIVRVGGVVKGPKAGDCYEMEVKYEESDSYCYWIQTGFAPPQIPGYCRGWKQETPFFYLVKESAAVQISKAQWRSKYGDRK